MQYLKVFDGIDAERAYKAVFESLTIDHKNSDWRIYEKYGYYPFDLLNEYGESVSRTLESAYDDASAARLAEYLGHQLDHDNFFKRSLFYRNLFDSETGFMRGKDSTGHWREPFDPMVATSPMNNPGDYTEANAYQYSWAAQHDPEGMIELFGSKEAFSAKLDEFFNTQSEHSDVHLGQEAMIGQYAHGNEPSHHIAYLYQFADLADKTAELVTRIYEDFYKDTPDGIQGNEDCGQMSAWYIFTTLGFYPVDPSDGRYVFGQPQVEQATILFADGGKFTVRKKALQQESILLNDEELEFFWIEHQQITQGGVLEFVGI